MCVERDLAPLFTVCRIQYAALQVSQGSWPDAERELTSVLDGLQGSRRSSRLDAVVQLGELRRRQGRFAEAESLLRQAEFHPVAVVGRALLRLGDGDPSGAWAAVAAVLRVLPVANRLDRVVALPAAVVTALAAGDLEGARGAAAELRETAGTVGTEALLGSAAAADAALASGRDAVGWWYEAVRHFHVAGLRFDEAECRLNLAGSLLAVGDRAAAHELAGAAVVAFTELDATVEADRARRVQAASGAGAGPITARETEVLRLVAQGLSNPQIARTLVLSEHTVHRHVANILTKLGQPSRAAATAYALTTGLI
jgi:ATP/maltotriose-dependent transcriptional regulator MalT